MSTISALSSRARTLLAFLLTTLLVVGGLAVAPHAAFAAAGDVASATLSWGIKSSFRNYIAGPIAHGSWTLTGGATDATPFGFSGGTGSADQGGSTGSVAYPGGVHFQGHEGQGVPAGTFALDVTISNPRVVQTSATAASLVVDVIANSLANPTALTTTNDVTFATVDLAAATKASTATKVAYTAAPATLTAAGATAAFEGFYAAGTALDPVTFSWPVEQPPAPPTPSVSVSKITGLSPAGETITVTGTAFLPAANTNGTRPPLAGRFAGAYAAFGKYPDNWRPSAGVSSTLRKNGATKWAVPAADLQTIGGADAGAVTLNADGSFTAELFVKPGFANEPLTGNYGIYTYAGSGATVAAFETFTPISFQEPPAVTVSKTSNLSASGETVTVTGTGFLPGAGTSGARPPLAGKFAGAYAVFGKYPDAWRPSEGIPSSARKNGATKWAVLAGDVATVGGASAGAVVLNADGTFTAELVVKRGYPNEPLTGNYGIYTYGGSGASAPAFETFTPITFSTAPAISVSKTTGLSPAGERITVSGYNFLPNAASSGTRPPLAGKFAGAYAAFGKYPDAWKPSAGVSSTLRKNGSTTWAVPAESFATVGGAEAGAVLLNADGSFTAELFVKPGFANEPSTGNYGIYSYGGSGAVVADYETFTPIAFTPATTTSTTLVVTPDELVEDGTATLSARVSPAAAGSVVFTSGATTLGTVATDDAGLATLEVNDLVAGDATYTATFTPTNPLQFSGSADSESVTVAPKVVAVGSLQWGIKESFRDYVTGGIAKGSIVTTGVTEAGGEFTFGQAEGGTFTEGTGTGSSNYSGAVRFIGHSGLLDVSLANPVVRVDSATSGTLLVSVNGADAIPFASLDLTTGIRSTPGNTVRYTGVAATLTAQGAAVFAYNGSPFYTAGTAVDPLTFTIGSAGTVIVPPTAVTPVVSLATSPASSALVGAKVTLTAKVAPAAAGTVFFRSGSTALGSAPVNGSGVATLSLSALSAGTYGFVAGFAPADPDAFTTASSKAVAFSVMKPVVSKAGSLSWGVNSSLRSYVLGGGSIATSGGAGSSNGTFVFPQSGNTFDHAAKTGTANYGGRVTFAYPAHGFAIALSNPRVAITSASTGVLITDVTYNGSVTSGVTFANLRFGAANQKTVGNTTTFSNVSASLTSAGAGSFAGFYSAGEALDPMSFVIGASSIGFAPSAQEGEEEEWVAPATAPSSEGITTDKTDYTAGEVFSGSASGFQPNEPGIRVVVYSKPIVVAEGIVADASGVASWTGALPAGLTGSHIVTFQGSVSRGIPITITAPVTTTSLEGCEVSNASLTWGFKESFRSYVSGSIAKGEWTVADGATYDVPNFGFADDSGTYDAEAASGLIAFPGSIRFTGHDGVLDTTVSNPQVRFVDASTAMLLLDVSGETQDGAAVDQKGVEFLTVDLASATVTTVDGLVTIADAPTALTPAGSDAFGTYDANEPFDALNLEFSIPAECGAAPVDEESAVAEPVAAGPDLGWLLWLLGGLLLVAIAVIVVLVVRRRAG